MKLSSGPAELCQREYLHSCRAWVLPQKTQTMMERQESASEKGPSGNGATPGGDCLTPSQRNAMSKDSESVCREVSSLDDDPCRKNLATQKTPEQQIEESAVCTTPEEYYETVDPTDKTEDNSPYRSFFKTLLSQSKTAKGTVVSQTAGGNETLPDETEFQVAKKRKRNKNASPETTLLHEIMPSDNIATLIKKASELIDFCRTNANVHKYIKNQAGQLRGAAERVLLDYKKAEIARRKEERNCELRENSLQSRIAELEQMNKNTQNEEVKQTLNLCTRCNNPVNETVDLSQVQPGELNSFREHILKKWHNSLFTCTSITEKESIGRAPAHIAVLSDRLLSEEGMIKSDETSRFEKEIISLFPELEAEAPLECLGGYSTTLEESVNVKIRSSNKHMETKRTATIMLRKDDVGDNIEQLHGLLVEFRKVLLEARADCASIVAPGYVESSILRKITECVFRDLDVKIQIIVAKGSLNSYAKVTRGAAKKSRGEALIVEATETRDYNHLLGTLKEKLNPDLATGVKGVKKTTNGNLLLQIREEAKASEIRELVEGVLGPGAIRTADGLPRKTFFVRGIDGMTEIGEVKTALLRAHAAEHPGQIKLAMNRNARGGQSAVVTMVAGDAIRLLNMRTIRIGFSDCTILERIHVDRCYRCWKFGHNARMCRNSEIDMSDRCYRCGQEGHHRTECKNEKEYCPSCQKEGHQSGTAICVSFRRALTLERRRRTESGASAHSALQ